MTEQAPPGNDPARDDMRRALRRLGRSAAAEPERPATDGPAEAVDATQAGSAQNPTDGDTLRAFRAAQLELVSKAHRNAAAEARAEQTHNLPMIGNPDKLREHIGATVWALVEPMISGLDERNRELVRKVNDMRQVNAELGQENRALAADLAAETGRTADALAQRDEARAELESLRSHVAFVGGSDRPVEQHDGQYARAPQRRRRWPW